MLPAPGTPCHDGLADPCCDGLFLTARDLLDSIAVPLNLCVMTDGCSPALSTYVTIGRPSSPFTDYLAVWVDVETPPTMPEESRRFVRAVNRVDFGVKLLESGWPMTETDNVQVFNWTPEDVNFAAAHSYAHLQVVKEAARDWMREQTCDNSGLSRITPVAPSGGSVGWEMIVWLEGVS